MTDIIDEVVALISVVPREPGTSLPDGASDAEITAFEKSTHISLPAELKVLLRAFNGPIVGPGGIYGIPSSNEDGSPRSHSMGYILELYPQWGHLGWIPITSDGCGNHFVLAQGSGSNPILFVETSVDPNVAKYVVGSDVWHFLRFLLQAELGSGVWPFDREGVLRLDPELERVGSAPFPWDVSGKP